MAGRGQGHSRPNDYEWAGQRLRQAMAQANANTKLDKTALAGHALMMFHAAVADAEEQTRACQFYNAAQSYNFAVGAAKKGRLLDLERLLELICSYAESLLRAQNWGGAFQAALETTGMKPDFVRGYMLMCKAAKGEGNRVSGARYALQGMVCCNMSNDDIVEFITEAADLLGIIKHNLAEGQHPIGEIDSLGDFYPSLPQTAAVWTRIMTRLLKDKKFIAVAFLTVGFTEYLHFQPTLSCLDDSCPEEVDCSSGSVDELYETLSPHQIKKWGERLAVYLVDHGAALGKRTPDPLGIHLVKLSIKHKSKTLLSHILTTQPLDNIQPDAVDQRGDTALHIIVKSQPYTYIHNDLTVQLVKQGTLPNIRDRAGKMPHEYVPDQYKKSALYERVTSAIKRPEEGFKGRINHLKQEGNQAHRTKNSHKALDFYQRAITAIESSPYQMPRDLAILYNNMAAVYASINNNEKACEMAARSVATDPAYHKPYWRLGKSLMEKKQFRTACDNFLNGMVCPEADEDQKLLFLHEVCSMLTSLSDKDAEAVVKQLMPHLTERWPKVVETLSKNASWDIIRRLVLGPPEKLVDKSLVPAGWKFADCYKDGKQIKVGYALCLKATTPALSTLLDAAEGGRLSGTLNWVTDLVLALLLQGAQLQSMVTSEEETCYHSALYLCCLTEKLGLMRYILSQDPLSKEAVKAINREKRTLLHSACLQFGDGNHEVGKQLVRLLLEKGVNPTATDVLSKKAVDYVAPQSPISRMLLKPPGPAPKTTEEMKERGNSEFKKSNYKDAIDFYTQAITMLQKKLPSDGQVVKGHEAKKHELAVLFSNRAECHLKLGNTEQAFSDARESVGYDGHWYRGHVRVGRALIKKGKAQSAIKAFCNAFNALGVDATETQKKDVLKEIVKTVTTHIAEQPPRLGLGYVSADLWALVAYDYFCSGNMYAESHGPEATNADWCAASFAFVQFSQARINHRNPPKLEVNLKPLCSWQVGQALMHPIVELIMFFLLCGADHSTLSFYTGDTFLHAAAILTFMNANSSLLDWLMQNRIKPRREENLQDIDGNTALHIFAMENPMRIPPPPLPPTLRHDLCKILVDWGVNPRVQNKKGETPLDCTPKKEKAIRDLLEKAMKRAPEPPIPSQNKPKDKPQTASSAQKTTDQKKSTTTNQPPKPTDSQASAKGNGTASKTETAQKPGNNYDTKRGDKQRLQCSLCEDIIAEAREYFDKDEKTKHAYSKLVGVLGYKHQKDLRHDKFVREAVELIVKQLEKSLTPDIPDVLLRVSQPHFHQILQKLAARDKWRQVEVVVDKARANDVPRGDFAKNMSVLNLVCDKGLCGAEAQRLQILNMLMSHGAQLHKTQMKEAMEAAIQHGEFRMVERLVELGVEPRCISLEMGDTPLHAALTVALDREKGNNFNLFEQLIALYEKDPKKYSYLDLACVDKDGNTLLHLAASTNYSKHSHKAVELLMSKDIPVDVMNKDGKIAIDYLKSHDRRTQYLRVAGKQTTTAPAKKKSDASKSQEGAAAFNTEGVEEHAPNEAGDNEYVRPKKSGAEKSHTDTHTLKTKDAVTLVTNLVGELSELTPAEAKLAKSAKGKWLEMEKTVRRESIPDSDEDEEEEVKTAATAAPTASGDAQDLGFEEEEVEEEEEEEDQEVKSEEVEDPDLLTFDNLEWEVECTAEVWKTLRDHRMTYELKQRIVRSIRFLASGEWRPQLCRKVHRVPDTIKLYQAKFVKGARILWELAIAFSPRLSEAAEKRIDEDERKGEFAVRGGRMYTEIIRIWDIVFQYDKLRPAIKRIIQSHERGEHCLIRRELKGVKSQQFQGSLNKRYPMLFSEADMSKEVLSALQREEEGKLKLYPPASASEMEFHILKFYCFSSALVYNVLKNLEMKIDFPFRVTDREHAVINLSSRAPILLLGRSGTGKTTCCLYRLWSRFLTYWTKSKEMDYAPWLPRTVQYAVDDAPETKEEEDPNSDLFDGLLDDDDDDNDHSAKGATAAPPKRSTKEARAAFAQKSYSQESCSSGDSGGRRKEGGGEEGEEDEEWEDECEETVISGVEYDHLHQLFVTKNQVLCSEVQKNFRELCHADDIAHFHVDIEESAMPHKLQDIDQYKFPLFVTSRQLILMLDASLPAPHFFERNDDGSLRVTIQGWGADEEIFAFVPLEDDSDEEEEEFFDEDEEGEGREKDEGAAADHRPHKKDNRREVTYEVFAHEIWPKITKKAQVSYHPSLVWTEIISFIKGSFASLAQPKGYLDLQGYEQLGRKQAPNFTGSRDKVYGLFLKYNEYKRQHGLYDEADLVFNIYQRLRTAGPLPWVLHEVFVDETQDFTQAELTVLIRLAHNPNDMFLTGDTAQSIMRGVSFRFSDLKTLFHYAKQSLKARGKTGMLEVPRHVYQLTHNYRSHAGILSLASAVLDLLVEFFPESFDRLEKDQGLFDGPQPVVLESGSPADLAILLSGNKRKTSHIEFGAHQVILVVSEEARNSLPEELNMGLVLTIYEAKGLEFDDVLLYNFFKDSQAGKEWRVVTDFLERLSKHEVVASSNTSGLVEIDEDVLQQTGRPRPLTFDPNLHKILNSELKHLYTAVTRARVNVWIFDQDADKRAPMFEYCKARKLVKFVSMREGGDEEGVSQSMFAEKSSPEEWEKRGDEIMLRSLYDVAAKCYAMAGAAQKRNIAVAHQRALQASHLRNQPRQMRDAFLKAAILFLECHQEVALSSPTLALRFNLVMKAGRCLQNARENYLAAMVFEKNGQPEVAGQLYLRARKWIAASQCFEHVDNFGRAVKILDEQELYDQAIDCLQRYKIRKQDFEKKGLPVPKPLVDHKPEAAFMVASLSYKAAMFYHRYGEKQKMLAAIERLPNKEDQITFLQKHGYVKEAAHLMVLDGRITEAARMMLHNGEVDTATIIAEESTDSSLKAQCYWLKAQQLMAVASKKAEVAQTEAAEAAKETIDPEAIQQVCKSSGCSEEEVSAALLETQGDIDKAVALLKESKKGGKKSQKKPLSSKASKKKGTEVASSDEDDDNTDDETLQKIVALLERARQQFDLCKDYSGLGECRLVLAKLRADKELLDTAFKSFSTAQPVSNTAGMLECVEMLHRIMSGKDLDLDSYRKLIWGVEKVFDVVRVLMQPATAEDKNRYQTYLTFYGLEKSGEGKLVLHPKLKPRCIRMVGSKQLFANKEEKKEERLYRSDAEVCNLLAKYLILRTKNWCREVEFYLESQLPKVIQCHSFKEGHDCEDVDFCPFLHETYTERLSEEAINILSSRVRLDHALQSGAKSLIRIDVKLSELTLSLAQQEQQWNSVETLLEFIFPAGLLTYNMSRVLSFCISVAIKSPLNAGIHHQVQRYLQHLWDNPGRVGKGKSENVLKERCKSTNWIVMASLLVPLFKLDIKVNEICNELEMQLRKRRPNWVGKRYKYALLQDGRVVITLARRHLDALEYLQPSKFDPVEALIKFTKFVKLLLDRGEVSLMPDLRIFLYWMEVFSTIALCLAAKIRGNGFLVLPSCYPRALKLFNLTLPQAQRGELLQMLENYKFEKKQTLKLLHDRIEKLVWLLCGTKPSQFCLLSHLTSLKKDKSMTNLLTERALILALTLLLNIEQGNTSELCELSILRCIHGIPESKMLDMPPRLASLIDGVQAATSYQQTLDALDGTLHAMDEKLQFFQWRWNRKDCLMPVGVSNVRAGGMFRVFRLDRHLAGVGSYHDATGGAFDEIDEDHQEGTEEEEVEEELSPEEKERYEKQVMETQREEQQNKASHIITRFMRRIIFFKHLHDIERFCVRQIYRDLFSPCIITDRMCGICGVRFEKPVPEAKPETPEGEKKSEEAQEAPEEDEETVVARLKQEHLMSEEHRTTAVEFNAFKEMYRSLLSKPLNEIASFLHKHEVKKHKDTWYKDLPFQVNIVLEQLEGLQQKLGLAIQERKWTERKSLISMRNVLVAFYSEHVRGPIKRNYSLHQEMQKQKTAAREAEQQHQERLMEGMVEDSQMNEILDVVDRPLQAAGPNANASRGVAGGGANRGRGRGRGRVFRGRGGGHGDHRGHEYKGHPDDQFGKGDLPPRFRR